MAVPEILLSGNHPAIARWRREQSEARSPTRRPDAAKGSLTMKNKFMTLVEGQQIERSKYKVKEKDKQATRSRRN